jgi:L-ascorbate metabolism protein UlaG (beta-lactamase superfamily)
LDITWYGHSCFRITERGNISIVTDPYSSQIGLEMPKLKADVVTISHDAPGHNNLEDVKGYKFTLAGPGEYEFGGTFIYGVALHDTSGEPHRNVGYVVQYNGLSVAHLGDLRHVPDQSTIEAMGEVNVALVPVGAGGALKASEAAEVIALIEPEYIVPMHYAVPGIKLDLDPVEKFLKEMGVSKVAEEEMLRVSSTSLPEQSQVVVLLPQR